LIVDPFTVRNEKNGVCDMNIFQTYKFVRGGLDVRAARKLLAGRADIDQKSVYLQGYSYGAVAVEFATEGEFGPRGDFAIAGAIEYYPYCTGFTLFQIPTLVLIGDRDDWTPADRCPLRQNVENLEFERYHGATHGFALPFAKPPKYPGHYMAYDKAATDAAEKRVDEFMDKHKASVEKAAPCATPATAASRSTP
jgi:dienelactone hydrolase